MPDSTGPLTAWQLLNIRDVNKMAERYQTGFTAMQNKTDRPSLFLCFIIPAFRSKLPSTGELLPGDIVAFKK